MAADRGEEELESERVQISESESDDFGSFSDASFENDAEEVDQDNIAQYLDQLLPDCDGLAKSRSGPVVLGDLLRDERPQVIYEQLVDLRTVLQPFTWDKSHLKANLWHILRIPEEKKVDRNPVAEEPLDDSLYKQVQSLLEGTSVRTSHLLKDHFNMNYTVPLTPILLHAEEEWEQERAIPTLLAKSVSETKDLTEYHDALCHAIDVVFVELRELNERRVGLMTDKTTFENVITNLTGHTQRLYRDEVALYNKRIKKRNKFGWGSKKV